MIGELRESAAFVEEKLAGRQPGIALVLGSGLGDLAEELEDAVAIGYGEIPHYPVSTVAGHRGRLVAGTLEGVPVLCAQGRQHYYEGFPMHQVVWPVRVMRLLGIRDLILTNASGGIRQDLVAGTLMRIEDHINMMGDHPLRGENLEELGPRFPDMSRVYDRELGRIAMQAAGELGIHLAEGVYVAMSGPSFETPAEIRFLGKIGADAVGMSTVPEAIAARHSGMRVLGISCVANLAAGIHGGVLTHEEVMEAGRQVRESFGALVRRIVQEMGPAEA